MSEGAREMQAGKPPATSEPESLIARWSRRKRRALDSPGEAAEPAGSAPAGSALEPAGPSPAGEHAPPALRDSDMPPLDSLGPESDYSGFLSPGVSEELRRLALRKLFHSPLFNVTDGLDDYDDDFTSFEVLREAFHAKRGRASASDPAGPEPPETETMEPAEAERTESTREPPAEGSEAVRRTETELARPLPAEPAGEDEAGVETASRPPAGPADSIAAPAGDPRGPDEAPERASDDSETDAQGAPPEGPDEPGGEEVPVAEAAPESPGGGVLAGAVPAGGALGPEVTSAPDDSGRRSGAEPPHG